MFHFYNKVQKNGQSNAKVSHIPCCINKFEKQHALFIHSDAEVAFTEVWVSLFNEFENKFTSTLGEPRTRNIYKAIR